MIEPHDELGDGSGKHEELYVVMTGRAEFELDGTTHDAPAGTLVFARPEQHRGAKAAEADTTILVIGGKPGAAGPAFAVRVLVPGRARLPGQASTTAPTRSRPRASSTTPTTARCTTSWAVTARSPGAARRRSSTCAARSSSARRRSANGPPDDTDIDSVRGELDL